MLGLIGGGLGLANSMFGGIKAAKERKRQDRIIREAKQRNEDFFNSEYYQNYMDRSDVQAAMKRVRDTMRKSNQTAAASAAVTGATPEAVVAQKQANNEIIADAASGIQANADAYKNNVKSLYLNRRMHLIRLVLANQPCRKEVMPVWLVVLCRLLVACLETPS